jgi:hypothetical protein
MDCRKREVLVFDLTGMSWIPRIAVTVMLCSIGACGGGGGGAGGAGGAGPSAIVGTLPSSIYRHRAIPDGPLSRIFSLDDSGSQSAINIYSLSTYAPIKSLQILGATLGQYGTPSFITWGTNGIAYTASNGQIVIVSGPYLQQ